MSTKRMSHLVLELNHIDELFTAPVMNPFSSREVEIYGASGFDRLEKRILQQWPRSPGLARLIVQLPLERITPDLEQQTQIALQRYCEAKLAENRLSRQRALAVASRQFIVALLVVLLVGLALFILVNDPFDLFPETLSGILAVLVGFIGAVAFYDSVWSLVFEWIPFVRDNHVYRKISALEISIAPSHVQAVG